MARYPRFLLWLQILGFIELPPVALAMVAAFVWFLFFLSKAPPLVVLGALAVLGLVCWWWAWVEWAMWHTAVRVEWDEHRVQWFNLWGRRWEADWEELEAGGRPRLFWLMPNAGFVPGAALVRVRGRRAPMRVPFFLIGVESFWARLTGISQPALPEVGPSDRFRRWVWFALFFLPAAWGTLWSWVPNPFGVGHDLPLAQAAERDAWTMFGKFGLPFLVLAWGVWLWRFDRPRTPDAFARLLWRTLRDARAKRKR